MFPDELTDSWPKLLTFIDFCPSTFTVSTLPAFFVSFFLVK
ncbi:ORF20 [Psittacine aviadenovirus B]|uniref:ORF20 n=1 Tax=psittacine adenovirus 4 TaxID=2773287 RepID=A0A1P8SW90_9ADEN|nr:ORF20 [Psittacine aviadenovirus B]APY28370.1 ORF20 [psittacine adenovirus 4]